MASVDQAEIDSMKRIMEAMNAAPTMPVNDVQYTMDYPSEFYTPETIPLDSSSYTMQTKPYSGLPPDGDAVNDMKAIMEKMNAATSQMIIEAESPVSNVFDKQALREALVTERTTNGVRIGEWEIVIKEGASHKTYDVVSNGSRIATGLYLYDAALALTKALNKGLPINDPTVKRILSLEEKYVKNRNDAVVFVETRNKALKKGDDVRASIAESRLEESKDQIDEVRQMLKLAGLR